jgi:hypothetical protein
MKKLTITINMDNAAFADDADGQLMDILATIGNRITGYGEQSGNLRDFNGNTCGSYKITGK